MGKRARRPRVPVAAREPEIKSGIQSYITTINKTYDLVKASTALVIAVTGLMTVTGLTVLAFRSDLSAARVTELIQRYCTSSG